MRCKNFLTKSSFLASLERSFSRGAELKNGEQKNREEVQRKKSAFSRRASPVYFLLAVFRAAPRLTERLEEATPF